MGARPDQLLSNPRRRYYGHRAERALGLRVPQREFHDLGELITSAIEVRIWLLLESTAVAKRSLFGRGTRSTQTGTRRHWAGE